MKRVTPWIYLSEILAMLGRHGGELAVAVSCVAVVGLTSNATRALLHLQAFGSAGRVFFVLLPAIGAILLFEVFVAAWRLYRRQSIALATTRSLLDLDAGDRTDLEGRLPARDRLREARVEQRNADVIRIRRVREMAQFPRAAGGESKGATSRELSRAEDDGWPVQAAAGR